MNKILTKAFCFAFIGFATVDASFSMHSIVESSNFTDGLETTKVNKRCGVSFRYNDLYGEQAEWQMHNGILGLSGLFHIEAKSLEIRLDDLGIAEQVDMDDLKTQLKNRVYAMNANNPSLYTSSNELWSRVSIKFKSDVSMFKRFRSYRNFREKTQYLGFYVPVNFYNLKFLTLDFVPMDFLEYKKNSYGLAYPADIDFDEKLLEPIMYGIEMDLRVEPNVRGYEIPNNTRILFTYFERRKGDNPILALNKCYSYLNIEQQNSLILQLLSIYLINPKDFSCHEYIKLMTQHLFENVKFNQLQFFIFPDVKNWKEVFKAWLRWNCELFDARYDVAVSKFVDSSISSELLKTKTLKLNEYLIRPIQNLFRNRMFYDNKHGIKSRIINRFGAGGPIKGYTALGAILLFCDFVDLLKFWKSMWFPLENPFVDMMLPKANKH